MKFAALFVVVSLGVCGPALGAVDWWQSTVVYQIYPRSFKDSDGDGIGDLKGIESKLDYLLSIGVECVWLSPIFRSPMADFGYDVSDYYDVDPIFGTLADFDSLMAAVKARGMKLVMDIVPNHTSNLHEWFEKSVNMEEPFTEYYTWADPSGFDDEGNPVPPSNWLSVFRGSAWEWNDNRQQFYLHQFLREQPDVNPFSDALNAELENVLRFWLDRGVDGFRVDAIKHYAEDRNVYQDEPLSGFTDDPEDYNYLLHTLTVFKQETLDVLRRWRLILDEYSEGSNTKIMMTEVTGSGLPDDTELLMAYYGTELEPIAHFTFNFRFIERLTNPLSASAVRETVESWLNDMPTFAWANWVIGNHDVGRVASRFDPEYIDAISMIVQLVPGTAITYQGEEIGMENTFISWEDTQDPFGCNCGIENYQSCSRDPERTPMQWSDEDMAGFTDGPDSWLPINDNYVWLNVEAQEGQLESHLNIYRRLTNLRRRPVIQEGTLTFYEEFEADDVLVFSREISRNGIAVAVNLGSTETTLNLSNYLPSEATVWVRSTQGSAGNITLPGQVIDTSSVPVGPKEGIVLEYSR
ncbi:unnamed protein product [Cyprideis torosa]|uniref:alpha-glucosidase n=1 Tax=Cyprideis torosa TaxID=163714 RepID=A0A7R8ZKZ3_9CRUS|nr:unnamed protein product [Cyprideis torosa]CAG0885454.1 unnamed protein product [Cyprideis torosa]